MGPDERDLDEEIRGHLALSVQDRIERGESPEAARLAALREFGYVPAIRDSMRRVWYTRWFEAVAGSLERARTDLRLAVRQLLKSPGFTLLAIVTLALGIGANTSMFSVLNGILLKPLPYAGSAQLESIFRSTAQNPKGGISPADFLDLQRAMRGYGTIAAYMAADTSLSEPGRPAEMAAGIRITSNFFSTLGTTPQLGRDFRPDEEVLGNDRVLVISHRYWKNRFGGDPASSAARCASTANRTDRRRPAREFQRLAPPGMGRRFPAPRPRHQDIRRPQHDAAPAVGRRSSTISHVEGERVIASFGARLATAFPAANAGSTWRTVSLDSTFLDGPVTLSMLVGLSGFVLLIACSNLANLLLARTMSRAREFAVRSALGASRTRLLRPLIAESLLLALAGGACASIVAAWAADWLAVRSTGDNGERVVLALDWHVLGWALAASLATSLAFGLGPALFAMRLDPINTLKSGGRGTTGGRGHRRFRNLLIVGQFALAMVLLAGAALFVRGLDELNRRRSGWESDHLVTGTVLLPAGIYRDPDTISAFHRVVVQRLESLPGVAAASISSFTPFFNWPDARKYLVEGHDRPMPGHEPAAVVNRISPHYFDVVGTRLFAGRTFNERDTLDSPKVFVINQAMAKGLFGTGRAIGGRVAQAGTEALQWGEIVGVVGGPEVGRTRP